MIKLTIHSSDNEILMTDKGPFRIGDDCVISEETGEVYEVAGSTTDENGNLSELMVE